MYDHVKVVAQLHAVRTIKEEASHAAAAVIGRDAAPLLKKVNAEFEAAKAAAEMVRDYIQSGR